MTTDKDELDEMKKHFEANLLDGDAIQGGQMLSSEHVWEWVEECVLPFTDTKVAEARIDELERIIAKHKDGSRQYPSCSVVNGIAKVRISELKAITKEGEKND